MSEKVELGDFAEEVKAPEKKSKAKTKSSANASTPAVEAVDSTSAPDSTITPSEPNVTVEEFAVQELEKKQEAALDILFPPGESERTSESSSEKTEPVIVDSVLKDDSNPTLAPGRLNELAPIEPVVAPVPAKFDSYIEPPFPQVVAEMREYLWKECRKLNGTNGSFGTLLAQKFKSADAQLIELTRFLLSQGFYKDEPKKQG